jgi:hypothetical protein
MRLPGIRTSLLSRVCWASSFPAALHFESIRIQVPPGDPSDALEPMLRRLHRSVLGPRPANIDNPFDALVGMSVVIAQRFDETHTIVRHDTLHILQEAILALTCLRSNAVSIARHSRS